MRNPFLEPVPANAQTPIAAARRLLEPIISEHMDGFGQALEGHIPKNPAKRVQAHQLLRYCAGCLNNVSEVVHSRLRRATPFAMEAPLNSSTLGADITEFTTQVLHISLDVYWRLIATRLASVQPLLQPTGFVFFLRKVAKDDGPASSAGRNLSTKSTFDPEFGDRGDFGVLDEGSQVKAVGLEYDKTPVQVKYKAMMRQHSHEVEVAMRTQYGLDVGALGDMTAAEELAREVDRQIINDMITFAATNPRGTKFFDDTNGGNYDSLEADKQQAYDKKFLRVTMTEVSAEMVQDVYVRPNWYVAGLNIIKLLARTPDAYAEKTTPDDYWDQALVTGSSVIQAGRMRDGAIVLHDPLMDDDTMLVGHTNNMNPFYAGFVFCPFEAASMVTAPFMDPDVLLEKRSRALAYGRVGIRPGQYRLVKLGTGS